MFERYKLWVSKRENVSFRTGSDVIDCWKVQSQGDASTKPEIYQMLPYEGFENNLLLSFKTPYLWLKHVFYESPHN